MIYINPETKKLIIEIDNTFRPEEELSLIRASIFDLITQRNADFTDSETIFWAVHLIQQLEPSDEQLERMLAEPTQQSKDLKALKKKHFEVSEELRVLKEKQPKKLWEKLPNLVKNELLEVAENQ